MSLIVASQAGAEFDEQAARHPGVAKIIALAPDDPDALAFAAGEADALIVRPGPVWKHVIENGRPDIWPGRLRWVQSTSAGVDYYPEWLGDVQWFSCGRGAASEQIADYVIGAIYAHAKDVNRLAIRSRDDWKPVEQTSLIGRVVAIIGMGSIGRAVASRLTALGARPVGVRRSSLSLQQAPVPMLGSIEEAVAIADDIVIALPATAETRGLVNRKLLKHARPHAHIINVARGSIVDQDDLLAALDQGGLGFATLDVTNPEPLPSGHPFYTHPKVRITPHISSNWQAILPDLYAAILENIGLVSAGKAPANLVNRDHGY